MNKIRIIRRGITMMVLGSLAVLSTNSYAQDSTKNAGRVPFSRIFYHMDRHVIGSFTHNYGLNFAVACAASYGLVKSGFDWKWYRNSNDHKWISRTGFISVGAGGLVPLTIPLGLYLFGRSKGNSDLQMTGLALGQAALLGGIISTSMKAFTGRVPPDNKSSNIDYSGHFRFGFLRGGAYQGWPSSHTTIAFAMGTTLIARYPDNTAVKIASLAYASLIGLGVSTNIHWFSDAVAGACIGYAIGKTVGTGFNNSPARGEQAFSFYVTPMGAGFTYRF